MEHTHSSPRPLPIYSKREETFHTISHATGMAFSLFVITFSFFVLRGQQIPYAYLSALLYGTSMLTLYTSSSIYHGLAPTHPLKRAFQTIDHCSVYLLIAGTYTPYCLLVLREISPLVGWLYFAFVWGMALLGIALNTLDLYRFRLFSNICYLSLGWCIALRFPSLFHRMHPLGFYFLILGGISYTIGATLYMFCKKYPYTHGVFHLFVLMGSILHSLSILFYVF